MTEVEVDEVFGFCRRVSPLPPCGPVQLRACSAGAGVYGVRTVGDEASKVATNNTVPCRTLAVVKCLLDVLCNVLQSWLISTHVLWLEKKIGACGSQRRVSGRQRTAS